MNTTMATNLKYDIIGAHNVRDLGGYKTKDGKVTQIGKFVRSDSLHRIHESGIRSLLKKNLTTVIDLRTKKELQEEPNLLAELRGVNFLNFPLLENLSPIFLGAVTLSSASDDPLLAFYLSALHERKAAIKEIFLAMSEAAPGLILFNCTAGKDRTGIISALLLSLVNVSSADIIKNYTESELAITELVDEFLEKSRLQGGDTSSYSRMLKCSAETMESALSSIVEGYGDTYNYLKNAGLKDENLIKISERMLE